MQLTTQDHRSHLLDTLSQSKQIQLIKKLRATPSYITHEVEKDVVAKEVTKSLKEYKVYGSGETDFMALRFDSHDEMLCVGGANGFVYIYFIDTTKQETILASEIAGMPITCTRWIPSDILTYKSIVIIGSCEGTVSHYNGKTGKLLAHFIEKDNQVLALDVRSDGAKFATAGKDQSVRVYDEMKMALDTEFPPGMWTQLGHSNRIFSVKFHPDDPHVLLSGGWDNTIFFWDTRISKAFGSIYGPSICGDTIDIYGEKILTGSYRNHNQLELWEFGTRKKFRDVFWENETNPDNALIYGCQFSKVNGKTILAGCSGLDEVRCFDVENNYKYFGTTGDFKHNIFSVDFANNSDLFAYCGTDGHAHTAEIITKKHSTVV